MNQPFLGQVLGIPNVRGYNFDVQIVTAPITEGSLSSCPPSEAVTWGKVDKDVYKQTTESLQADYTLIMPILVKALLDRRQHFADLREKLSAETLFERHPEARGYLRERSGYRLYDHRERLVAALLEDVRSNAGWLNKSLDYPLAIAINPGEKS